MKPFLQGHTRNSASTFRHFQMTYLKQLKYRGLRSRRLPDQHKYTLLCDHEQQPPLFGHRQDQSKPPQSPVQHHSMHIQKVRSEQPQCLESLILLVERIYEYYVKSSSGPCTLLLASLTERPSFHADL